MNSQDFFKTIADLGEPDPSEHVYVRVNGLDAKVSGVEIDADGALVILT